MATQPIFASVPKPVPDLNEIQRACKVVISGAKRGRVVEVRALKTPYGTCSGYYTDATIIQDVYNLSLDESVPNVYWTIQELKQDVASAGVNTIRRHVENTTEDIQTERYLYIPIDCDPRRPARTSSTETEKAYSHDVACEIRDFLSIHYGIESILADSGNGYHVLVRVDMAVSDATVDLVKKLLVAFKAKFGTERVDVDTVVYNPSRILKVYGSVARKGEHTDERPWRTSRLVEVPDELPVVQEDTLRALLAEITTSLPAEKAAEMKRGNIPADPASKEPITEYRNKTLTSIAGTLRDKGLEEDEIHAVLTRINEERCEPMLPDHEIDSISKSVARYEAGDPVRDSPASFIVNKEPSKKDPLAGVTQVPSEEEKVASIESMLDRTATCVRPVFPHWVMEGTTLNDNLVAPAVELSSKYGEFIFMAAVQALLNYVSLRIRIKDNEVALNMYLGFVSPYGQFFKSSCAELAHKYFEDAAMLVNIRGGMTADGRVVVSQAGSPEGFCLAMDRANGHNGIMYSDELVHVVSKASIQSSSYVDALLAFYELGKWDNLVKDAKKCVVLEAKKYCYGWLWCTTDRSFDRHWPKLAGDNSGLVDRMFFVISPAKPRPTTVYRNPYFGDGCLITRRAVDKALEQGVFAFEDATAVGKLLAGMDPRSMQLVQKLSLYFAIDLGREVIDGDCVERAMALVEYRNAAKRFLDPPEADNEIGRLQMGIMRTIRRAGGKMSYRELCRKMDYKRFGTELWERAFGGLKRAGDIMAWTASSEAGRVKNMVGVHKWDDGEESE